MPLSSRLGELASTMVLQGRGRGRVIARRLFAEDRKALRDWVDSCDVQAGVALLRHFEDLSADDFGKIWCGLKPADRENALAALLSVIL